MNKFLTGLWTRFQALVFKLVGFKGLIWIIGTKALFEKIIDGNTWMLLSLGLAGVAAYQKAKVLLEGNASGRGDNNGA